MIYQNRKPFKLASRLRGMTKKTRQQKEGEMYDSWKEYMDSGIITTKQVYNPKMGLGNEALYCKALVERYITK